MHNEEPDLIAASAGPDANTRSCVYQQQDHLYVSKQVSCYAPQMPALAGTTATVGPQPHCTCSCECSNSLLFAGCTAAGTSTTAWTECRASCSNGKCIWAICCFVVCKLSLLIVSAGVADAGPKGHGCARNLRLWHVGPLPRQQRPLQKQLQWGHNNTGMVACLDGSLCLAGDGAVVLPAGNGGGGGSRCF
jgi:hypothetical protein